MATPARPRTRALRRVAPRTLALSLATCMATLLGVSAAPSARAEAGPDTTVTAAVTSPGVIPFVVPSGALFTRPPDTGGTRDQELAWNILVEHLLDATPKGATVTGSLFSLTAKGSQAALKRADQRGVKVRMLLYDRRADESSVRSLVRSLNDHKTPGSFAKVCQGSCYGRKAVKATKKRKAVNPGVQHFKAFTFSTVMETSTQATTNVWTAGSGNLTNGGSGWNSYVVEKQNPAIVATLTSYMMGMRADKQLRTSTARTVEEGIYKFFLYPQKSLTPDPVYDTLKSTTCVAPAGFGSNGRTVVRVGIFAWTPYRDLEDELIRLHRAGCDVQVIVSATTVDKGVMKRLIKAGVPLWNGHNDHGKIFYYIHDKNVIIDGTVGGSPTHLVLTGSNNFTDGGLTRNTESIIRIRDLTITNQFLANWALIQGFSKPVTKVSQLSTLSAKSGGHSDPENMEEVGR